MRNVCKPLGCLILCVITTLVIVGNQCIAETYTVTNNNDYNAGSLRQAILDANTHTGADTIVFASNVRGVINLTSSLPNITESVNIIGPGAEKLTIDANSKGRIFYIYIFEASRTMISGLTITRARYPGGGAGIATQAGDSLFLSSCVISNNVVNYNYVGGGGIYLSAGYAEISNCTITGNVGTRGGSGIAVTSGANVIIDNCTISNNPGGGDYGFGGGIYNAGHLEINNSTISNNTAGVGGGGIYNILGRTYLNNVTITGNTSPDGGGIYCASGDTVFLANTIVAGNTDENGGSPDISGVASSFGHNLIQSISGCTLVGETSGNIIGADPGLNSLAYNGGPTGTNALLSGSPAIDAGDETLCAITDQRGIARPQDGNGDHISICDIGAFEYIPDLDNDGVSDTEEKGPDGKDSLYDGNEDDVADLQQGNVVSLHDYSGVYYITISSDSGTTITECHAIPNPLPTDSPIGWEFPFSFFEYTVNGVTVGGSVIVQLYLPSGWLASTSYWKYGSRPGTDAIEWYEFLYDGQTGATFDESIITLHFVDGVRGDDDTTANGVVKEPGGPAWIVVDVSDQISEVPKEIQLFQNYPNPFNPNTVIQFELPRESFVRLELFNILGQQVATLVNGKREPGKYQAALNGSNLPSGVYFYQLRAEGLSYTKKLLIMR
jgi:predicted outer membrane repeat protein